ncbi:TolC family protein, partial [Rhodobaculum claviforme]
PARRTIRRTVHRSACRIGHPAGRGRAIVRVLVPGLVLLLAGCVDGPGGRSSADPATPLEGARTASGAADFALAPEVLPEGAVAPPRIDPGRSYGLPELIDIAQRTNPRTQAAWHRARAAAAGVGVVEATYLPQISANVLAGGVRTSTPEGAVPPVLPAGRLTAEGATVVPNLALQWLLFDFGRRDAARQIATEANIGANIAFQGLHQQVIFEVASGFYRYNAARADTRIARARVQDAATLRTLAAARRAEGLGTEVDVAQTRQIEARAVFDRTLAENRERDARARLLRAMGLSPTTPLRVADIRGRSLPREVPGDLDRVIAAALERRPDIQAALAQLRATDAGVALVEAERRPRVLAVGEVGRSMGRLTLDDTRIPGRARLSSSRTQGAVGVMVSVPVVDGGLRAAREEQARARAAAAERDLEALRTLAATEIVEAYDLLRTSLAAHAASGPLLAAAEETWRAVLGFYENGLASLAEVSIAKTALNDAQMVREDAYANAFVAAAALAFATGELTSRDRAP